MGEVDAVNDQHWIHGRAVEISMTSPGCMGEQLDMSTTNPREEDIELENERKIRE